MAPADAELLVCALNGCFHPRGRFFLREHTLDLLLNGLERLRERSLSVGDFDDVIAVGRADELARAAYGKRERRLFERRNHGAPSEQPEVAAAIGRGILGVLAGELGEIGSRLHLRQHRFGLRAYRFLVLVGDPS